LLQPSADAPAAARGADTDIARRAQVLDPSREPGARRRRRAARLRLFVRQCAGAAPPRRARLDDRAAARTRMVRPGFALLFRPSERRFVLALQARPAQRLRDSLAPLFPPRRTR